MPQVTYVGPYADGVEVPTLGLVFERDVPQDVSDEVAAQLAEQDFRVGGGSAQPVEPSGDGASAQPAAQTAEVAQPATAVVQPDPGQPVLVQPAQ